MKLNPPPVDTGVDKGASEVAWPWLQWFQNFYRTYAALIGPNGGKNLQFPYGEFYDTTNQTAAANTVTAVLYNTTQLANGFSLSGSHVVLTGVAGYYNIIYSLQLANTSAATDNITVWFRQNGVDVPDSAAVIGVPAKHGAVNGATLASANTVMYLSVGDYVELYWATDNGSSSLYSLPASAVAPVHPLSPGVVLTFQFVSS